MATTARHRVEAVTAGWFTPPRLLALFCLMSLLVYVDRGVISSAAVSGSPRGGDAGDPGSGLQGEFGVGYALFGLLQAAFMLGLLLGAPAFSAAAKTWNPFKLIGLGLAGWTLAVAGCATATTYAAFFFCRVFVGLGEASFCALAAPFIDDFAPPGRKTLWLAAFYLCIPLGVAGGVMFGGAVAGAPEGQSLGWRWAFGLEAVAMTPVALFCLASEPIPMRGVDDRARVRIGPARSGARDEEAGASPETAGLLEGDGGDGSGATAGAEDGASSSTSFAGASASARGSAPPKRKLASSSSGEDFASLRRNRAFLTALAGYVAYTGTIGVYAAWGPKAGYGVYSEELGSPSRSDVVLGGITVLAGVAGTLMGGVAADAAGADARAAVAVCAVCAAVAFAFLELAFRAAAFATFACLFAIGQTFAFGVQAPVNAVVLRSVRARERPLACSLVTVVIHLLGDVPTPPLFGLALEASAAGRAAPTPGNWRAVLGGFTALMAVAAATWAVGGAAMTGGGGGEGAEGDAEGDAAAEGSETAASASDASSGREDGDAGGVASRRRRGDRGLDAATVPFLAGGAEGSAAEEARGEDGRARETETRRARARARGFDEDVNRVSSSPACILKHFVKNVSRQKSNFQKNVVGRAELGTVVCLLRLGRASRAAAAMATLPYVTVDAFTTVKFRGNPAAVVVFPKENTADALEMRQRQAKKEAVVWTRGLMPARTALAGKDGFPPDTFLADVAREMHLSETAFVKMRPPPRQKKQPSAEGEADVAPSGTKSKSSRVSFPFDDAGSDEDARDEGVDGASTDPPSPALSVASRSSAGSDKKVDRDAVAYVEYDLRWFTRSGVEVDLCGHATLAAAHALYELGPGTVPDGAVVRFHTRGGVIPVARVEDKKRADDDGAASPEKRTTPLLELVLPCAPPRLAALGGKDVAPAGDDSDDDDPPDPPKRGEANEGGDEPSEKSGGEGGGGDAEGAAAGGGFGAKTDKEASAETFATPPAEAGVFFHRGDVAAALGVRARDVEAIVGRNAVGDVFVCLTDHAALRRCVPDAPLVRFLTKGGRGLVACAAGGAVAGDDGRGPVDFSCRFFGPNVGIDEDPVTGSAFCGLAPYWQARLGRKNGEEMLAHQASARGGVVRVAVVKRRGENPGAADETKVHVRGRAVSVLKGEILSDGFEAEEA